VRCITWLPGWTASASFSLGTLRSRGVAGHSRKGYEHEMIARELRLRGMERVRQLITVVNLSQGQQQSSNMRVEINLSVAAIDMSCSSACRARASAAATLSSALCSFSSAKLMLRPEQSTIMSMLCATGLNYDTATGSGNNMSSVMF